LVSGKQVYDSLIRQGFNAVLFDVTSKDIIDHLKSYQADACINMLHGSFGEDGSFQALCDSIDLPCSGSGMLSSALTMNKHLTKIVLETYQLPILPSMILNRNTVLKSYDFEFPWCIKPLSGGSSVGIELIYNDQDLQNFYVSRNQSLDYIIEPLANGYDVTVGIVNKEALPPICIKPKSGFYDYHSKYIDNNTEYLFDVDLELGEQLKKDALSCFDAVNANGFARVDFILHNDKHYILEINSIPGMTEHSLVPKAYAKTGKTFDQLVRTILDSASVDIKLTSFQN